MDAQEYAEVIAAEVRELEASLVALLREDVDAADFDGVTFTDAMDVLHYYVNTVALTVEDVSARTYGEDAYEARRSVEVLRSYGGPNAYVNFDGHGTATVRVYSGRERGTYYVSAPLADAELWELMDALAAVAAVR